MTPEELDRAADMIRAIGQPDGTLLIPWADLPEFAKNTWRALVEGDAGAAVD